MKVLDLATGTADVAIELVKNENVSTLTVWTCPKAWLK